MDDPLGVSGGKAARRVDRAVQGEVNRQGSAVGHQAVEVVTADVFHGQEVHSLHLAGVENGDDIGMVQAGRDLDLATEPLHRLAVAPERRGQDLHCDDMACRMMPRLEDDPHPPLTQLVQDEIVADRESLGLSLGERGRLVSCQLARPHQCAGQA